MSTQPSNSSSSSERMAAAINYLADTIVDGTVTEKEVLRNLGLAIEARAKRPVDVVINRGYGSYRASPEFLAWYQEHVDSTVKQSHHISRESIAPHLVKFGRDMLIKHNLLSLIAAAQPHFSVDTHSSRSTYNSLKSLATQLGLDVDCLNTEVNKHCYSDKMSHISGTPHNSVLVAMSLYADKLPALPSMEEATIIVTDSTCKEFGLYFLDARHRNRYDVETVNSLRHYVVVDQGDDDGEYIYYPDDMYPDFEGASSTESISVF